MSYHLYHTEGYILSSTVAGESNRFYHIYTEQLGLIGVWGQGVRKLESKLRYNMQDLTRVKIHVVRGKNMWRLTDVESVHSFRGIRSSHIKRQVVSDIAQLVKRLLDEGGDEVVYTLLTQLLENIEIAEEKPADSKALELLFVVRLLQHLGYGDELLPRDVVYDTSWNSDMIKIVKQHKKMLARAVNRSLQETQM